MLLWLNCWPSQIRTSLFTLDHQTLLLNFFFFSTSYHVCVRILAWQHVCERLKREQQHCCSGFSQLSTAKHFKKCFWNCCNTSTVLFGLCRCFSSSWQNGTSQQGDRSFSQGSGVTKADLGTASTCIPSPWQKWQTDLMSPFLNKLHTSQNVSRGVK